MVKVLYNTETVVIGDSDILIDTKENPTKITFYKDDDGDLTVRVLTMDGVQKFFLTKKQALEFVDKLKEIYGEK